LVVIAAIIVLAVAGITGYLVVNTHRRPASQSAPASLPQPASTSAANPPSSTAAYGPQTVLPFTGLNDPQGVAVDSAATVYATDLGNRRVVKLAVG
jgi:hypothetical protein